MENQEQVDKRIKELIVKAAKGAGPGDLAEIGTQLSGYAYLIAEELKNIVVFEAERWLEIRKTASSDKMAEKLYDATDEGKETILLKFKLKYIERVISSINRRLKIAEGEAYNRI